VKEGLEKAGVYRKEMDFDARNLTPDEQIAKMATVERASAASPFLFGPRVAMPLARTFVSVLPSTGSRHSAPAIDPKRPLGGGMTGQQERSTRLRHKAVNWLR
jgi:hypothetical protein